MQRYVGGIYAAMIFARWEAILVYIQALPRIWPIPNAERHLVRTESGEMTLLPNFQKLQRCLAPVGNRFNLYNLPELMGRQAPVYSTGDALAVVQKEVEPSRNFDVAYSGLSRRK